MARRYLKTEEEIARELLLQKYWNIVEAILKMKEDNLVFTCTEVDNFCNYLEAYFALEQNIERLIWVLAKLREAEVQDSNAQGEESVRGFDSIFLLQGLEEKIDTLRIEQQLQQKKFKSFNEIIAAWEEMIEVDNAQDLFWQHCNALIHQWQDEGVVQSHMVEIVKLPYLLEKRERWYPSDGGGCKSALIFENYRMQEIIESLRKKESVFSVEKSEQSPETQFINFATGKSYDIFLSILNEGGIDWRTVLELMPILTEEKAVDAMSKGLINSMTHRDFNVQEAQEIAGAIIAAQKEQGNESYGIVMDEVQARLQRHIDSRQRMEAKLDSIQENFKEPWKSQAIAKLTGLKTEKAPKLLQKRHKGK